MNNGKELIKIGVLFVLVVFFAIFFTLTKGNDELDLDFNFKIQEEFSYPVSSSEYNGLYYNEKGNNHYVMIGKNSDNTYRVYFINGEPTPRPVLKLDSTSMDKDKKITFIDTTSVSVDNLKLAITFNSADSFVVGPAMTGFSNAKFEGHYMKIKGISNFAMSEFQYKK